LEVWCNLPFVTFFLDEKSNQKKSRPPNPYEDSHLHGNDVPTLRTGQTKPIAAVIDVDLEGRCNSRFCFWPPGRAFFLTLTYSMAGGWRGILGDEIPAYAGMTLRWRVVVYLVPIGFFLNIEMSGLTPLMCALHVFLRRCQG
jgi:hypothetical protein